MPSSMMRRSTGAGQTPRAIINQLSTGVARILELPEIQEQIARRGAAPKSSTPEAFDELIRNEIAMRRKVWKAAGVKVD